MTHRASRSSSIRAIRFRWQDGMAKGFNDGDGESLSRDGALGASCALPRSPRTAR